MVCRIMTNRTNEQIIKISQEAWRDTVYACKEGLQLLLENGTPLAIRCIKDIQETLDETVHLETPARVGGFRITALYPKAPDVPFIHG